ncbi:MAG: hypothetical protein ACTFAL_01460 [Candidatus Electronema sp. V4]|uniref:hypothetical protein n=1 Tax=Candidatus Electronema sp. V4 TaxID=3454756 RepID=UPI0040555043
MQRSPAQHCGLAESLSQRPAKASLSCEKAARLRAFPLMDFMIFFDEKNNKRGNAFLDDFS